MHLWRGAKGAAGVFLLRQRVYMHLLCLCDNEDALISRNTTSTFYCYVPKTEVTSSQFAGAKYATIQLPRNDKICIMCPQVEILQKHPHMIVATPGRLLDLIDDQLLHLGEIFMTQADRDNLEVAASAFGSLPQTHICYLKCSSVRGCLWF